MGSAINAYAKSAGVATKTQTKSTVPKNTAISAYATATSTPPPPVLNKLGLDVSSHPFNPLNKNSQFVDPNGLKQSAFPQVNPYTEAIKPKNWLPAISTEWKRENTPTPFPANLQEAQKNPSLTYFNTGAVVHSIKSDPLNLQGQGLNAIRDVIPNTFGAIWNAIKEPIKQEGENIKNVFKDYGHDSLASQVSNSAKVVAGGANILFSPISALFAGADKIPVLGTVTKALVDVPFSAVGETAPQVTSRIIDRLPISQQAKNQLKPGIGEIAALASQIYLGKVTGDVTGVLKNKYGAQDAKTIVEQATRLANEKKASEFPKVNPIPSEVLKAPVTPKTAPTEAIKPSAPKTTPKDPLTQEALKYKSADEFVNSQKTQVFRGGGFEPSKVTEKGTSFSFDRNVANQFPLDAPKTGADQFAISNNAKILEYKDIPLEVRKFQAVKPSDWPSGKVFSPAVARERHIVEYAKKNGYDAVNLGDLHAGTEKELRVLNPDVVKTKSQLIDIYNKAHEVKAPKVETTKVSKVASDINTALVEKGFNALSEEQLAKFDPITKKATVEKVGSYLGEDMNKAIDSAKTGKVPSHFNEADKQVLFNSVAEHALKNKDYQLISDLANSPIATERSISAQTLGAAGFNKPDTLMSHIADVVKAREKKVKTGVKEKTVGDIKEAIKKTHTKQSWSGFVESLKC